MRVALLHDSLGRSLGGIEAWLYHAAEALLALGHTPYAVAPAPDVNDTNAVPPGVPVVRLRPPGGLRARELRDWKRYWSFSRQLQHACRDVDAFWSRSYLMTLAAHRAARGRPTVYIQATTAPVYAALYDRNLAKARTFPARLRQQLYIRMVALYERLAMKRASALVYLSQSRRDETLRYYGEAFRAKCHVVPPGVDVHRFTPSDRTWTGDDPLRTVTVCRLRAEKNIECLIRAVAILKERNVPVRSVVVGEGVLRGRLEKLSQELGVSDRVLLVGRQEAVERFYGEADLFVLPSTYEGFGIVYVEAFACGLPCIAIRNIPGKIEVAADEIIEHDRTGLLIDDNSPGLLADALLTAYRNPARVATWSRNAREKAEKCFSWELVIQRVLALSCRDAGSKDTPDRSMNKL